MVLGSLTTLINLVGPFVIPVILFVGGLVGYLVLRWLFQHRGIDTE
jgi:hypothetical protein